MTDRSAVTDGVVDALRKHDHSTDQRKRLLARMAGNIAAGIATNHFDMDDEDIAKGAVAIAEKILKEIGL